MSLAGHSPPPFFKRGPAPLARLVFFVLVSLVLIAVDLRFRYLEIVRQTVAIVAYPLRALAMAPVEAVQRAGTHLSSIADTQSENASLLKRQAETAAILLRYQHVEQENARLRRLLDMRERTRVQGTVAEILYAARDPFSRKVIIDKGRQSGVAPGLAVVDDTGVIGQVTRVYPLSSEITLITDKNQAVPVQVQRNGLRSVLFGAGRGLLELKFLPTSADVKVGDLVVTSGLDGIYLPGLPVARVLRVDLDQGLVFARIFCEPLGGVERHGAVLVLGPKDAAPPPPAEEPAQALPREGSRSRRGRQGPS